MTFIERAVERAGLLPLLLARRAGQALPDVAWEDIDLLVLGAIADETRATEIGHSVHIHPARAHRVTWIEGASDLDLLRRIAVARITTPRGTRIGVDWSRTGLELAQVALGFGASDLTGPITRKAGLPILDGEARKVKGKGSVALATLKRAEIASLVAHAGRTATFEAELPRVEETVHA